MVCWYLYIASGVLTNEINISKHAHMHIYRLRVDVKRSGVISILSSVRHRRFVLSLWVDFPESWSIYHIMLHNYLHMIIGLCECEGWNGQCHPVILCLKVDDRFSERTLLCSTVMNKRFSCAYLVVPGMYFCQNVCIYRQRLLRLTEKIV